MRKCNAIDDRRFFSYITCILIVVYELVMASIYFRTDALVPDEIWFLDIIESLHKESIKEIINTPNMLGYGSIYWILYGLLGNINYIRVASFVFLSIVPISLIVMMRKVLLQDTINTLLSVIILLSSPMSWFTGKIIGPELMGNAFGMLGVLTALALPRRDKYWRRICYILCGSILIGISASVKLYNVVFEVFLFVFLMCTAIENKDDIKSIQKELVAEAGGFFFGFVIANPFMLKDFQSFCDNVSFSKNFKISNFYDILFLDRIEWDLVFSGGINHGIIAVVCLIALILRGVILKTEKKSIISSCVSMLFLVILVGQNRVAYSWYFLPFLFFVPLLAVSKKYRGMLIVIILTNVVLMSKYVGFQIQNKNQQFNNLDNKENIYEVVDEEYSHYMDYEFMPLIDMGIYNYSYHTFDLLEKSEWQFIVISDRSLVNDTIRDIYQKAESNNDGYSLINSAEGIHIIIYNANRLIN